MTKLRDRLSRAIVRLYPRAWRERYGAELLALIEDTGSTWPRAFNLTYGCADAWLRTTGLGGVLGALLGAVLVRVMTNTAMSFSLIPPESWRSDLFDAFCLINVLLVMRVIWVQQRLQLTHVKVPASKDAGLSSLEVRALSGVILIMALGADFTRLHGDYLSDLLHSPLVPIFTFNMLLSVRNASASFRSRHAGGVERD